MTPNARPGLESSSDRSRPRSPTNEEGPDCSRGRDKEGEGPSMSVSTVEVPLFEGLELPPALARNTDPVQSHKAAKRVTKRLSVVRRRVLRILVGRERVSGNDLNDLYREAAIRSGWDIVRFDTPRKRAGELAVKGLLMAEREIDGETLNEALYTITPKGLAALAREEAL